MRNPCCVFSARARATSCSACGRFPRPCRVRVAVEQVRRKRHAIADAPAENVTDGHAPRLAEQIETGEFKRGDDLRSVVVERCGRVREHEPHFLQPRRVAADERRLQREHRRDRRLTPAAHFTEPDEPGVTLNLDDRSDEPAPVAAVRMPQRSLERHRHRRRADVSDLHGRGDHSNLCIGESLNCFRSGFAQSAGASRELIE